MGERHDSSQLLNISMGLVPPFTGNDGGVARVNMVVFVPWNPPEHRIAIPMPSNITTPSAPLVDTHPIKAEPTDPI